MSDSLLTPEIVERAANDEVDVFAYYDGFPETSRDPEVRAIMDRFPGRHIGAGCWIGGERDVQYRIAKVHGELLVRQLKKAGFRAKIREISNG